eukprot:TRINITY_DN2924_c0_g1_i1.p2 TRINITY_DN2924_c0_g1~~TRINITY_DN2924_c0_g1_i1.p2  ORF type:complete len:398 (+),score=128.73 TRINITY_DN2924_c0_g1_i1:75-1268(+)
MGFKPRSSLKVYHNIKNGGFIYPDESEIKGSTLAMAALLDRMLAMDKIAICLLTARANVSCRFVALLPQAEEFDEEDGMQRTPPGFHIVYLPFADDIRNVAVEPFPKAENHRLHVEKAKKIVKTLRIKFDSRNFENPALQKHYAGLQALALEREGIEPVEDMIQPDEEGMAKYSNVVEDFIKSGVLPEGYDPFHYTAKKAAGSKRVREDGGLTDENINRIVTDGTIHKYTVPELKAFLKEKNVKFSSKDKKGDLVAKVQEFVGVKTEPADDEQPAKKQKLTKATSKGLAKSSSTGTVKSEHGSDEEPPMKKSKSDAQAKAKSPAKVANSASSASSSTSSKVAKMQKGASQSDVMERDVSGKAEHHDASSADSRPMCMYGAKCYRKNPEHLREYRHPK